MTHVLIGAGSLAFEAGDVFRIVRFTAAGAGIVDAMGPEIVRPQQPSRTELPFERNRKGVEFAVAVHPFVVGKTKSRQRTRTGSRIDGICLGTREHMGSLVSQVADVQ